MMTFRHGIVEPSLISQTNARASAHFWGADGQAGGARPPEKFTDPIASAIRSSGRLGQLGTHGWLHLRARMQLQFRRSRTLLPPFAPPAAPCANSRCTGVRGGACRPFVVLKLRERSRPVWFSTKIWNFRPIGGGGSGRGRKKKQMRIGIVNS